VVVKRFKRGKGKYHQGTFIPKNLHKYDGDYSNITYRSSWELHVFKYFDTDDNIIKWNSEEIVIPYFDVIKGKMRKYYLDVYYKTKEGKEFFGEIKPKIKLTSRHKDQNETINIMNKAKATIEYIKVINKEQNRNIEFIFITD